MARENDDGSLYLEKPGTKEWYNMWARLRAEEDQRVQGWPSGEEAGPASNRCRTCKDWWQGGRVFRGTNLTASNIPTSCLYERDPKTCHAYEERTRSKYE